MSTRIVKLEKKSLDDMAAEARACELGAELKDLAAEDDGNYAILETTGFDSPENDLKFVESPSEPPDDADKICTGKLEVDGEVIDVDAYRLA